jgi:hypothetical protein
VGGRERREVRGRDRCRMEERPGVEWGVEWSKGRV